MILFGHAAVGALIGTQVVKLYGSDEPMALALALVIGLVSHYLMDMVPHGHYEFNARAVEPRMWLDLGIDAAVAVAMIVLALLFNTFSMTSMFIIGLAIAGALLPDVITVFTRMLSIEGWGFFRYEGRLHRATHWHNGGPHPTKNGARGLSWTDIWQVAVLLVAIYVLVNDSFNTYQL